MPLPNWTALMCLAVVVWSPARCSSMSKQEPPADILKPCWVQMAQFDSVTLNAITLVQSPHSNLKPSDIKKLLSSGTTVTFNAGEPVSPIPSEMQSVVDLAKADFQQSSILGPDKDMVIDSYYCEDMETPHYCDKLKPYAGFGETMENTATQSHHIEQDVTSKPISHSNGSAIYAAYTYDFTGKLIKDKGFCRPSNTEIKLDQPLEVLPLPAR